MLMLSLVNLSLIHIPVVDLGFVEVGVWYLCNEHLSKLDWPVEWIEEWIFVSDTATSAWSWVEIGHLFFLALVCLVWGYHEVELEWNTTVATHGEHLSLWEVEIVLFSINVEFFLSLVGTHYLLEEILVRSPVTSVEFAFLGATLDDVLTSLQVPLENVNGNKVPSVFSDVHVSTIFIVFRSKEYSDHSFGILVGVDEKFVGEWFVVETILDSPHLEFVFFKFIYRVIHSVAYIRVEFVEVCDKSIHLYLFDGDTGEYQVLLVVGFHVVLEFVIETKNLLDEHVESGVSGYSFSMFQS